MSNYAAWKVLERRTAKRFGGRRLWRARDFSESVPDGESATDVWDCKYYQRIALLSWWRELERKYREFTKGRRFLLVLSDHRGRGDFVLVRAEDYAALLDCERQVLGDQGLRDLG
jgi:hypothetical protein